MNLISIAASIFVFGRMSLGAIKSEHTLNNFEALYVDNHPWLLGLLRQRLGNAADAADLAHSAFLRLLQRPPVRSFESPREARTYLRKMANGLCIDMWRRREVEQAWLQTLASRPDAVEPSAEHRAIVVETLLEISHMLSLLPRKAATAFVMAQVGGLRYREIAVKLDVSERMVKKYMAQAMLQCALIEAGLDG